MTMTKTFRGKKLNITVKNESGAEGGFKEFYLNGVKLDKPYVAAADMKDENKVIIVITEAAAPSERSYSFFNSMYFC